MLSIIEIITNPAQFVGNKTPKLGSFGRPTKEQGKKVTKVESPKIAQEKIRGARLSAKQNKPTPVRSKPWVGRFSGTIKK